MPEDLHVVTQFMHDAGVLMYFPGVKVKSIFWECGRVKVRKITGGRERVVVLPAYLFIYFLQKQAGGMVILNPQWLANVMATIITFSHKWVKNGVLLHSDLAQLWKDKYPQSFLFTLFLYSSLPPLSLPLVLFFFNFHLTWHIYHPNVWNLLIGLLESFEVLYPLQRYT
jgi:hypothetical protein